MKIISLGGIGGCDLANALRDLNQPAYPYDWLITTQSFIINSFNDLSNFFAFNEAYVYNNSNLLVYNKKAIMLHDFNDFTLQKEEVLAKYTRRFERLNESLTSNDEILFIRIYDNLQEELIPKNYYDSILIREEESIDIWEKFINYNRSKYNKNIRLLIITSRDDISSKTYNNIILVYTKDHKNNKIIYNIIQDTINSLQSSK